MFYRLVDSKMGEDGDKLRAIEMDIFYEVVKQEVEHLHGPWEGSMEENQMADMLIATLVKNSFKKYEVNKMSYEPEYFRFWVIMCYVMM